jgi:hypothetical protein
MMAIQRGKIIGEILEGGTYDNTETITDTSRTNDLEDWTDGRVLATTEHCPWKERLDL